MSVASGAASISSTTAAAVTAVTAVAAAAPSSNGMKVASSLTTVPLGTTTSSSSSDSGGSDKPSTTAAAMASFKLLLLVMMVAQNSTTVLVGRYTRAGVPKEELYDVNHLIFLCEWTKFVLSCALEFHTTKGQLYQSLQTHVFQRPLDALKILVPALLYLIQNTLLYVALSNLTAPLFQVTYQAKLVTTAIVSVMMLNRKYSPQQWVCLVILSLGVAIVVLGEKKGDDKAAASASTSQNLTLGLTSVTIACLSSALAGVYFEKVLKKPSQDATQAAASLWMRNIQLAFFSFCIAALQGLFKKVPDDRVGLPYLHGFTGWVWFLVGLQAGGGLLVAAVIKYADNVLKGLATGVSVVVATLFSIMFFGTPLSAQFSLGATMILSSVYVFSNPVKLPPAAATAAIATAGTSNNISGGDQELNSLLLEKDSDRGRV